jgi:hypothetical protein
MSIYDSIPLDTVKKDIWDTEAEIRVFERQIRDRREFIDKLQGILKERGESYE